VSTNIKSVADDGQNIRLAGYPDGGTYVEITGGNHIGIHRADFLAAVETECGGKFVPTPEPLADWERELLAAAELDKYVPADAIVIDRALLPEVEVSASGRVVEASGKCLGPEETHESLTWEIAALIALREYLDAHPATPVAEEDVETLAGLMPIVNGLPAWALARRMLATGRVSVTHE